MNLGPVQLMVIGFDHPEFHGAIAGELAKLTQAHLVRVLDALVVQKDDQGEVTSFEVSGLSVEEMQEVGSLAGALIGLGAGGAAGAALGAERGAEAAADGFLLDDLVDVLDEIPAGSAAAVILIEHQWAAPLRDAIIETNGEPIVDMWIHPLDLVAVGAVRDEDVK